MAGNLLEGMTGIDHSECVAADWSHKTHNHKGVKGAWLFPDEVPAAVKPAKRERPGRYDPLPDLAAVLAGLQVARSIAGGHVLGAAREPFDRLRRELHIFGWPGAPEHERMIRAALAALPSGERS